MSHLNGREYIAKLLGYSLIVFGAVFAYFMYQEDYFPGIVAMVVWCALSGIWSLYSGCFYFPGSKKAPQAFVYGKTARFLGVILLVVTIYFVYLLFTSHPVKQ